MQKTSPQTAPTLHTRDGLPDALKVLLQDYPRAQWEGDPGFDGLVRFWLDRHMMFRRLLAEMDKGTRAMLDGNLDPRQFLGMVSRYGGMFVNGLHEHHTIEDMHYFPKLAAKDARIESGFALLDADHHALDEYLAAFVNSANTVLQNAGTADLRKDAAGGFHAEIAKFGTLLDRHLTDEEDLIVPVILRYGAGDLG